MPEPRINLFCGPWACVRGEGGALKVRHAKDLQDPGVAQSGNSTWKVEALRFEGGGRYRPDQGVLRSDVHPQPAIQVQDGQVTLHGSCLACFARAWNPGKIWQIEYPSDIYDMSQFFLKDNRWDGAQYLTIDDCGQISMSDSKPATPWTFKPAGTAWRPSEVTLMVTTLLAAPLAVSVMSYFVGPAVSDALHMAQEAGQTIAVATAAKETSNNYVDANIFCINKQSGRLTCLRPKLFKYA